MGKTVVCTRRSQIGCRTGGTLSGLLTIPVTLSDPSDSLGLVTDPNDLPVTAIANFTDANKVLNAATGADVTQPVSFNTDAVQFLGQLQTAEDTITTHTGPAPAAVADTGAVPTPDQAADILNRVLDPIWIRWTSRLWSRSVRVLDGIGNLKTQARSDLFHGGVVRRHGDNLADQ